MLKSACQFSGELEKNQVQVKLQPTNPTQKLSCPMHGWFWWRDSEDGQAGIGKDGVAECDG
jgi:hypothetical protein